MDIYTNKVDEVLKKIAGHYGITIDFRWKRQLIDKIGHLIDVKRTSHLSNWVKRNSLPQHAVHKITALDIPEEIKHIARTCEKKINPPAGKVGFSLEMHQKTGQSLQAIYNFFIDLISDTSRAYPVAFSDKIRPLINILNELRSDFDSNLYKEYPALPDKDRVYYSGTGFRSTSPPFENPRWGKTIIKLLAEIEQLNPTADKLVEEHLTCIIKTLTFWKTENGPPQKEGTNGQSV